MSKQREHARVHVSLTPSEASAFLAKLAYDDDFRHDLLTDPQGTLAEHGINLPKALIPASINLPPKEKFADLLSKPTQAQSLSGDICVFGAMIPFMPLAIHRQNT